MDATNDAGGRARSLGLVRIPALDDRLIRIRDGARFRVTHVARIEGGEARLTMRSDGGEVVQVGADDLFPPLHVPQPFRLDR